MADVVLDYNQVIEETPVTGDVPPTSGGLITFQFKCDVNGATDLSNSFFAADLVVESANIIGTGIGRYIPDAYDFHAFPMLRCFQSVTHIIDGQTVCNSQHPYADALIVEKYLTTHSKANIDNFQSLSLMKRIDNGMKEHNIFSFDKPASLYPHQQAGGFQKYIYDWAKPGLFRSKYGYNKTKDYTNADATLGTSQHSEENVSDRTTTVLFQPPFDLWRLRQPFHGGIHQVQFNLKAQETNVLYGGYMTTTCVGLSVKGALLYDLPRGHNGTLGTTGNILTGKSFGEFAGMPFNNAGAFDTADQSPLVYNSDMPMTSTPTQLLAAAVAAADKVEKVKVEIKRLRFLRRVLRTAVPPQLSNVQYNFTEISMQHGTPTRTGVSQQFLLPSTTFGLIYYWRESTNSFYDQVGLHPKITKIVGNTTTKIAAGTRVGPSPDHISIIDSCAITSTDTTNNSLVLGVPAGSDISFTTEGFTNADNVRLINFDAGSGDNVIRNGALATVTNVTATALTLTVHTDAGGITGTNQTGVGTISVAKPRNGNIPSQFQGNQDVSNFYALENTDFSLHDFQFTYGGATYPMQRINKITGNKTGAADEDPYGWMRLMTLQNQLQGVYNSTMDDFPQNYGHGYGKGVIDRMDPQMLFFPVSRTGNSDNGILQVEYTCNVEKHNISSIGNSLGESASPQVQLVVVALYDAQLNMQYSSNELQQIVLTQFK
mgnify:CR=1 FL=1